MGARRSVAAREGEEVVLPYQAEDATRVFVGPWTIISQSAVGGASLPEVWLRTFGSLPANDESLLAYLVRSQRKERGLIVVRGEASAIDHAVRLLAVKCKEHVRVLGRYGRDVLTVSYSADLAAPEDDPYPVEIWPPRDRPVRDDIVIELRDRRGTFVARNATGSTNRVEDALTFPPEADFEKWLDEHGDTGDFTPRFRAVALAEEDRADAQCVEDMRC